MRRLGKWWRMVLGLVGRAHGGVVAVGYAPMARSMGVRVRGPWTRTAMLHALVSGRLCAFDVDGDVHAGWPGLVVVGWRLGLGCRGAVRVDVVLGKLPLREGHRGGRMAMRAVARRRDGGTRVRQVAVVGRREGG